MKHFFKINLSKSDDLLQLNGMQIKIFFFFLRNMREDNYVFLLSNRERICEKIGCTKNNLKEAFKHFVELDLMAKSSRDCYMINPFYSNRVDYNKELELKMRYLEMKGYEIIQVTKTSFKARKVEKS